MPHIDIKLFPGRSEEMKKAAAAKIIEAASAELGAPTSAFSVAFTEIEKDAWNETVADKVDEATIVEGKLFRCE
ncbi:MAG: tautomerase family protein [Dorea sp.]